MKKPGGHDVTLVAAALIAPLMVIAAMLPFRERLEDTDAALIVVLVIVALASTGRRSIGILAALSAGLWFDVFLVPPYGHLTIGSGTDLVTTLLLLGVGIAVTELAAWGRRQQARASRGEGYVSGIHAAAEAAATGGSPSALVEVTCAQLTSMFLLEKCTFDYGTGVLGGDRPRLRHDGQVESHGTVWNEGRDGLPPAQVIELLADHPSGYRGRFLLTTTDTSYSTMSQRLVAVALADQVGASLNGRVPAGKPAM